MFGSVLFRGFLSVIPLLIAMICGYLTAVAAGVVDFSPLQNVSLFTIPDFHIAKFDLNAILTICPVILVITAEHIGHQVVTSKIVGRDLLKEPGLHRSLLGDNLSTAFSGLFLCPPPPTARTSASWPLPGSIRSRSSPEPPLSPSSWPLSGPLSAFIATIPGDVIGGITFLLYGMIGTSGLRILVDKKVDYGKNRNLILTSVVFVAGLSGLTLTFGAVSITGMTLAAVTAVIISLLFYLLEKAGLMND